MTTGRFGSQWLVSPEDLDQVKFYTQEDLDGLEEDDEGDAPPATSSPVQCPSDLDRDLDQGSPNPIQAELLEEDWEPERSSTLGASGEIVPVQALTPNMEQQALHQAGYWKGRWDEARERILELEERQKAPLQLVEDLEASRQAEESARLELERLRTQLVAAETERTELQLEVQRLQTEAVQRATASQRPWWKRIMFKEVGR